MSEERSRTSHNVEDLSIFARRGALSAADQQAFAKALEASATLTTAHQLGLDFDRIATLKPGDDALIAEVAARVVSRRRTRGFIGFRRRALLLVASLTLAGSAAAIWQFTRVPAPLVQTPTLPGSRAKPAAAAPVAAGPSAPAAVEPYAVPQSKTLPPPSSSSSSAARAPSPRADDQLGRTFDSADALFREANAARRAGDKAVARALYLRLEHDFPASDEAHLTHVSLGNLLLAMGRASEAEQQFASYQGGRSELAQEALVGRAQSLATLGRDAEEQRVWQGLLHDYPSSVYAGRARQRLAELAGSAAHPE
jgi:TolA-binding protein